MESSARFWITAAAVLGGLAVTLGAFGAHGLDSYFEKKYAETEDRIVTGEKVPAAVKYLADFKTGVRYHMWHALALLGVGILTRNAKSKSLSIAGWSFLLGIILFSGSLYVLTIFGLRWMGAIAPIGGTLLIVGWVALVCAAWSQTVDDKTSQPAP